MTKTSLLPLITLTLREQKKILYFLRFQVTRDTPTVRFTGKKMQMIDFRKSLFKAAQVSKEMENLSLDQT
jgi:hypothetical protein